MPDLQEYKIQQLETKVNKLEEELEKYKEEQAKKETNRLVAGISFLGSVILGLGVYIWNNVTKGLGP